MDEGEVLNGFQFDNHHALDQQVNTQAFVEMHPIEFECNNRLPHNMQAAPL